MIGQRSQIVGNAIITIHEFQKGEIIPIWKTSKYEGNAYANKKHITANHKTNHAVSWRHINSPEVERFEHYGTKLSMERLFNRMIKAIEDGVQINPISNVEEVCT